LKRGLRVVEEQNEIAVVRRLFCERRNLVQVDMAMTILLRLMRNNPMYWSVLILRLAVICDPDWESGIYHGEPWAGVDVKIEVAILYYNSAIASWMERGARGYAQLDVLWCTSRWVTNAEKTQ
jgi:hypothetical protein